MGEKIYLGEFPNRRVRFEDCPKCGEDDPAIYYRPGDRFEEEFFGCECRRCGYTWKADMDGLRK